MPCDEKWVNFSHTDKENQFLDLGRQVELVLEKGYALCLVKFRMHNPLRSEKTGFHFLSAKFFQQNENYNIIPLTSSFDLKVSSALLWNKSN